MAGPDDEHSIPVIDLAPFLAPAATPAARLAVADAVLAAFRTHGFLYITNHGIPAPQIAQAFAQSARFFALPDATKSALAWTTPAANRGFSRMGQERVSRVEDEAHVAALRAAAPDRKESLEIGREGEPAHPNRWPPGDAPFREGMLAFHAACAALHRHLLAALALALRIDEAWFAPYTRLGDNTLRLLHYPAVAVDSTTTDAGKEEGGKVRAGAHTDFGSLTLLFQDAAGGLQVQAPDRRRWIDAAPREGTVVVNAGDLLARWTNGLVRSTLHRVVEPPAATGVVEHPARYSIAYFCNPDFDRWIDVVPGTLAPGEEKRFDGVNSGEYLVRRLTATY